MAELGASIFAVISLMVIAVMLQPLAKRFQLPHSVLLTSLGIILGLALQAIPQGANFAGRAYLDQLSGMGVGAEAVFYLLLIPMVFHSAARINVRYMIDDLGPISLLAIAGTVLTVTFIGYALQWLTGAELVACLLIGAIASSTDPLPVQEVLRDMGVPKRVDLLVEGESLFADSTALVAYALFLGMLVGTEEPTFSSGVSTFIEVSAGGIIIGYFIARFFCALISRVSDSAIARNTLAICMAYVCYYVVEEVLGYSGVIAVLVGTFVLATYGKANYSPTSWQAFLELSGQINFIAKTMVFLLVGMVAPALISGFTLADLQILLVLFVFASLARAVVIYIMLPVMSSAGISQPVEPGLKVIMFWGSSRGAISLALAMAVMESSQIPPEQSRFIASAVTAFVLATLFINATTMEPLLKLLKLNRLDRLDLAIKDRALFDALSELSDDIREQLEYNPDQSLLQEAVDDFDSRARALFDSMARRADLDHDEWTVIGLTAVAQYEQRIYLKYQENRLISAANARVLLGIVGDLIDGVRHHGRDGYYGATSRSLNYRWLTRLGIWIQRYLGNSYLLRRSLSQRFETLFTLVLVMEEIDSNADTRVAKLVYRDVMEDVIKALRYRLENARDELQKLHLAYPEYGEQLEQNLHKLSVGRLELQKYQDMLDQAIISNEVYEDLREDVEARIQTLSRPPGLDLELGVNSMLARMAMFDPLTEAMKGQLAKQCTTCFTSPGEKLISVGDPGDAMYFISSGAVRVELPSETVHLGSGAFFGEMALLSGEPRNANIYSDTYCRLLKINREGFLQLLGNDERVKTALESTAQDRCA